MTQEDKQLLLRDLCARLPYRVIAYASEINKNGIITDVNVPYNMINLTVDNNSGKYELVPLFDIRPYLRPMSSMTDEERLYFHRNSGRVQILVDEEKLITKPFYGYTIHLFDWLNVHYFDYRNLIGKGLALEAPEEMYKL